MEAYNGHNYLYYLSRRIAIEYCEHFRFEDTDRYVVLDNMLKMAKRYSPLPRNHYSENDVIVLSDPDFPNLYLKEIASARNVILKIFPDTDFETWERALAKICREADIDERLNGLTGDVFTKCLYMQDAAPYSIETPDRNKLLSISELLDMNAKQLLSVIYQIESYDLLYGGYGLGIDNDNHVYVTENGKRTYLPLYGDAQEYSENRENLQLKEETEYER